MKMAIDLLKESKNSALQSLFEYSSNGMSEINKERVKLLEEKIKDIDAALEILKSHDIENKIGIAMGLNICNVEQLIKKP